MSALSPDAIDALFLFRELDDQWRTSMAGATALDLSVFFEAAPVIGVSLTEEVLYRLKVISQEVLAVFAERREADERKRQAAPAGAKKAKKRSTL